MHTPKQGRAECACHFSSVLLRTFYGGSIRRAIRCRLLRENHSQCGGIEMKRLAGVLLLTWATAAPCQDQPGQQVWSGRISDSMCGASHQMKAGNMSDRECLFECLKAPAKYVLVDD